MSLLPIGSKAPEFSAPDQQGKLISLSDFKGQTVVLYFYPKDDTPGCTKQACAFRDSLEGFTKLKSVVLGISTDDSESHAKFVKKYDLNFHLIADPDKTITQEYGFWVEKSMYGKTYMGTERSTVIIGPDGKIL